MFECWRGGLARFDWAHRRVARLLAFRFGRVAFEIVSAVVDMARVAPKIRGRESCFFDGLFYFDVAVPAPSVSKSAMW